MLTKSTVSDKLFVKYLLAKDGVFLEKKRTGYENSFCEKLAAS